MLNYNGNPAQESIAEFTNVAKIGDSAEKLGFSGSQKSKRFLRFRDFKNLRFLIYRRGGEAGNYRDKAKHCSPVPPSVEYAERIEKFKFKYKNIIEKEVSHAF